MDTQIRRAAPAPGNLVEVPAHTVVLQEIDRNPIDWTEHNSAVAANRPTLSLPGRRATAHAAPDSTLAATANKLRQAILRCASNAQSAEPEDTDARLHCFVAGLSGSMEVLGEVDLDHALWDLMKLRAEPCRRTDASTLPSDGASL